MDLLPAPPNDNNQRDDRKPDSQKERRQRRHAGVLTVDECLMALSALPKLIVLGILTPAQASAARATYQAILNFHGQQDAAPHRRPVDQVGFREALRANPQFANFLAGVLSDEDIADLLSSEGRSES